MKANKGHLPMNYKRADNRSSWLTGYRLCVYASGSMITDILNWKKLCDLFRNQCREFLNVYHCSENNSSTISCASCKQAYGTKKLICSYNGPTFIAIPAPNELISKNGMLFCLSTSAKTPLHSFSLITRKHGSLGNGSRPSLLPQYGHNSPI